MCAADFFFFSLYSMNVGDPHFLFAPGGQFTWTMSNIHSAVRRLTTRIPEVSKLPDWYSNDHIIFIFNMRPIGSPKAHISLLRDLTGSGAKTSCQSVTKTLYLILIHIIRIMTHGGGVDTSLDPCCAEFVSVNMKIYLPFELFINKELARWRDYGILPRGRQRHAYTACI